MRRLRSARDIRIHPTKNIVMQWLCLSYRRSCPGYSHHGLCNFMQMLRSPSLNGICDDMKASKMKLQGWTAVAHLGFTALYKSAAFLSYIWKVPTKAGTAESVCLLSATFAVQVRIIRYWGLFWRPLFMETRTWTQEYPSTRSQTGLRVPEAPDVTGSLSPDVFVYLILP